MEPTVALIGASLPALHQIFTDTAKHISNRSTLKRTLAKKEDSRDILNRAHSVECGYHRIDDNEMELQRIGNISGR